MVDKQEWGDELDKLVPLSGEDVGDHVEVRRWKAPDGSVQSGFFPEAWGKINREQRQLLGELQHYAVKRQQLREAIDEVALDAREAGASWAAIGWCVGMTGEGARLRWKDVVRLDPDDQADDVDDRGRGRKTP